MGNDGGSIPKRRELVREAARAPTAGELKATALESLGHAWSHDALTGEPLDTENVVSDWRGRLYNYENILKRLMPGADEADDDDARDEVEAFATTGIRSLRDIVKLRFKTYTPPAGGASAAAARWACPVSQKELGPSTKAVYLARCGHVFAEVAVRQLLEAEAETIGCETACPECSAPFVPADDVVAILPTEKRDVDKLAARMDHLKARGLTHGLKKDKSAGKEKKSKKRKGDEARDGEAETTTAEKPEAKKVKDGSGKKEVVGRVSGINNAATAALTARVLAEQEERNRKRRIAAAT